MKDLKRCIYTSSYDRGLEHLLELWPDVKRAVPKATLHVFYGWQLFEKFYKDNPSSMKWMNKIKKMMEYDGVTDHGRIPQHELVEEYKKAGIWAYPTHFGEINCISGLKAQAYGCEPVVIKYAALEQTVKFGKRIEGDIYDDETKEKYKQALIDSLNEPMEEKERKRMAREIRLEYSWDMIAKSWDDEFGGDA